MAKPKKVTIRFFKNGVKKTMEEVYANVYVKTKVAEIVTEESEMGLPPEANQEDTEGGSDQYQDVTENQTETETESTETDNSTSNKKEGSKKNNKSGKKGKKATQSDAT